MVWFIYSHLDITNKITYYLPQGEDRVWGEFSSQLADSALTRTIVVTLSGMGSEQLVRAAARLADAMDGQREVVSVRRGIDPQLQHKLYQLLFPRRYAFLSDNPEAQLESRFSNRALKLSAQQLKRQLGSPLGTLIRRIADSDPLLAFPAHLQRLERLRLGELVQKSDQFFTKDGKDAVIFITSRGSAFDTEAQKKILDAIQKVFNRINQDFGSQLHLELSGVNLFAIASERSIRADVTRISLVSTAAIIVFFILVFRSLRMLLLAVLPIIFGIVTALAITLLVYGRLHGITLAFGATLTGVCIDYPIHYLNHYCHSTRDIGPVAALRRIWPALWLGCVTTVLGLIGLAWTSFPGIREIAIFSAVSVVTALLTTRFILPDWLPRKPRVTAIQVGAQRVLSQHLSRLPQRGTLLVIVLSVAVLLSGWGLTRVQWQDDLRSLSVVPVELSKRDRSLRKRLSGLDTGRFIVAIGSDTETALRVNDRVWDALQNAQKAGELLGFTSLHSLVWSEQLQRRNLSALKALPDISNRVLSALAGEGFDTSRFEPFVSSLNARIEPLTLKAISDAGLADLLKGFLLESKGRVGIVTYLRGVRDGAALENRIDKIDHARFFDQAAFINRLYTQYRQRTIQMIAVGLIFIAAILLMHYRDPRRLFASLFPSLLAAATTISVLSLLGIAINLLHIMSLLLVLSMGVDYGVFLVESAETRDALGSSLLSVVLACLFTVLSFGLMAMSDQPALTSIGQTTGLGVVFALLFSPISLSLVTPKLTPRAK